MSYRYRSAQKELIDLGPGYYTPEEYDACLHQLDGIGRYLGGDAATLWALRRSPQQPKSILDVGCGGGLFTIKLAQLYSQAQVTGVDIAPEAIQFAERQRQNLTSQLSNINFTLLPAAELSYPAASFDVVTATLVCHHLSDDELVLFLKQAYRTANHAIVLNDLHRHRLASVAFSLATTLFFPNRLIKHDGQLSIKRAFTRKEWLAYLQAADIPVERCSVTWHWAFRWIVVIDASSK